MGVDAAKTRLSDNSRDDRNPPAHQRGGGRRRGRHLDVGDGCRRELESLIAGFTIGELLEMAAQIIACIEPAGRTNAISLI
jgi:hypothetical protein